MALQVHDLVTRIWLGSCCSACLSLSGCYGSKIPIIDPSAGYLNTDFQTLLNELRLFKSKDSRSVCWENFFEWCFCCSIAFQQVIR